MSLSLFSQSQGREERAEAHFSMQDPLPWLRHPRGAQVGLHRSLIHPPHIAQFTQPDSIIPDPYNPLDCNRYAYARYNPIKYTDPTGHIAVTGNEDDPYIKYSNEDYKNLILERFGVTMSDGINAWGFKDIVSIFIAMGNMNSAINGILKNYTDGATLQYDSPDVAGRYSGFTGGSTITFYADSGRIPYQNIYHEFGHLMDNACSDKITNALGSTSVSDLNGNFVFGLKNGVYTRLDDIGYSRRSLWDSNRNANVAAQQHSASMSPAGKTSGEEWADMWANFVAGNIDISSSAGRFRSYWVSASVRRYAP